MDQKKVNVPWLNPAGEIVPLAILLVTNFFIPYGMAFAISIPAYFLYLLVTWVITKSTPSFIFVISGAILHGFFLIFMLGLFRTLTSEYILIISEIALLTGFAVSFALKDFFIQREKQRAKNDKTMFYLMHIRENFFMAKLLSNIFIMHLIIILIYKISPDDIHLAGMDRIVFPGLLFGFVSLILLFSILRITIIKQKIRSETWLPIVNEKGGVIGKIALSVSLSSKKAYLHPIVRIALICKGLLYLCERPDDRGNYTGKIDFPFEKFVLYNHSLEMAVENTLMPEPEKHGLIVKFIFKYLHKSQSKKRLVYFYTCRIEDEASMKGLNLSKGKLWTEKQIEENLGKGIFSESFEKEYEILKNTILLAEKTMGKKEHKK